MKHALSVFAVVFVALLALAGRAEAYNYRHGPDYSNPVWIGSNCTSNSQCGTANPEFIFSCDYPKAGATQKKCLLERVVCGNEQNSTVAYNSTTGYCEYSCTSGTWYDISQDVCVPCSSNGCCESGNFFTEGQQYCGNSPGMPDDKNEWGYRYACMRDDTTGVYALVPTRCNNSQICDNGSCVDARRSCRVNSDCVGNFVDGWCERTSTGAWVYASIQQGATQSASCSSGYCNMSRGTYYCSQMFPQTVNACLCALYDGSLY